MSTPPASAPRTSAPRAGAPLADAAARCGAGSGRDAGSTIPLVLLCFLVAAFLVAGTTAASSAFLAQRDLQADCDGAAVAAADAADLEALYAGGATARELLPLAASRAQEAAEEHAAAGPAPATVATAVSDDGTGVTVTCARVVRIPFGALFGLGGGLERTTASTARSPLG